ncbi:hypothetical protein [Pseudoalteromonas porphyrae]|uniref:Uncharacterized protein n=1 Tax=Pseudoalteromonas porphyrae TaxID=187330 RepID=A0A0N1EVS4_9GAMM|nr:hypothetical protein [Pseudoalteromonas porphyrae]KPH64147.1 hypothetical protein ADS77_06980 [Pseudoalteromonas porphyrae]
MTSKKMTFAEIKKTLKERDVTFTDIAKALELTPSHVRNVAFGSAKSKPVAEAISLSIGVTLESAFGDEYLTTSKRGPKDRTERKQAIYTALRNQQPVPAPQSMA